MPVQGDGWGLKELDLVVCGYGRQSVVAVCRRGGIAADPDALETVAPEGIETESAVVWVDGKVAVLPEEGGRGALRVGGVGRAEEERGFEEAVLGEGVGASSGRWDSELLRAGVPESLKVPKNWICEQ